jgi:hypothetical protein
VLLPGLVNAHAHLARHLARGLGLRTEAEWSRYESALSPEDVYWSSLAALVEGLRHGVTTVCDFHRSSGCMDLSLSEVAAAARKLGVRVAACYGAAERDTPLERRDAVAESLGLATDIRRRREGRMKALLGVRADTLAGLERLIGETRDQAGAPLPMHVELAVDLTPASAGAASWVRAGRARFVGARGAHRAGCSVRRASAAIRSRRSARAPPHSAARSSSRGAATRGFTRRRCPKRSGSRPASARNFTIAGYSSPVRAGRRLSSESGSARSRPAHRRISRWSSTSRRPS